MNELPTSGRRLILGGACCVWPRESVVIPETAVQLYARRRDEEKARRRGGRNATEDYHAVDRRVRATVVVRSRRSEQGTGNSTD